MVQHAISSGAQIVFVAVFEVLVKGWNKNPWVWRHWRPSYHCQQNRAGLHLWRGYLHWRYCLVLAVLSWGTNNPRRLCDDISHCLISPTSWEVDSSLPSTEDLHGGAKSRDNSICRLDFARWLSYFSLVSRRAVLLGSVHLQRPPVSTTTKGQGAAFSAWELSKGLVSAV